MVNCRKHKNIFLLVVGLIVICLFVAGGCRKKTEPAPPPAVPTAEVSHAYSVAARAEDEKTVRQLANEFTAAFRLESPTPIARLEEIFADDFCQRTTDGDIIQGKPDNLSFYRSRQEKAQKNLRSRTVQYNINSVRMSPYLAVVFGKVEGEKWWKNNPKPDKGSFWEILVFQKIDGRWYLVEELSIVPKPPKAQQEAPKNEKPVAEETNRTEEHSRSPYIGFGVGAKRTSGDGNKPPSTSDSNDKGLNEAAVPETIKLSPEQTKNLDEFLRGSFSGIGADIGTHPDGIHIKKVFPEGPAGSAGLKDGEVITAVNGESTVGMPLERAVSLLKGPEGTSVNLKVLSDNGTLRDVSVVRGIVLATGVENRVLEPNIGLLAISGFSEETPTKVRDVLTHFQQQKIKGLVLDLRNNKGGFSPAVKEVTSMFTGPDQIMWYAQYAGQAESTPEKGIVPKMVQWPTVVLINSETMCGGELLASAIKSKAGGKLLGQKTFGEGFIYRLEKQPDGSSRKVPIGRFTTADKQIISGSGISPDRELDTKLSSEETLEQAVNELTTELQNRK
ncbi:MAG: S41 family peptidase [Phycisphaerae bacterium]|nr:S41 family peptidase [Phycisphaerae bacterium]